MERDRPQVAIWSGTGHRWQYGAGQATGGNMEWDRPQVEIWSGTGHRWQYGVGQATGDNMERDRPQVAIWSVRFACWMTKATETHSQCVILTAFPLQQWLRERASMLRYRPIYFVCLVRVSLLANTLELPLKDGGFHSL